MRYKDLSNRELVIMVVTKDEKIKELEKELKRRDKMLKELGTLIETKLREL